MQKIISELCCLENKKNTKQHKNKSIGFFIILLNFFKFFKND